MKNAMQGKCDINVSFPAYHFILRFVKIQQEMNDILKLARKDVESMQRVKPDKLDKPNPLLELYHQMVYQKKYFDSKRNENRNFQTQGW